jgi:MFS family permease
MPSPSAGGYRVLLADRVVLRVFALAMSGRFGYALLPLVLLFTISGSTGSFPTAASASALFGVSGLVMPVQARLLDRHGQRTVLPLVAGLFVVDLVAMTVLGAAPHADGWTWYALALLGGITAPALGPSMRAQWRHFAGDGRRTAAYSLDAVAEEVVFLLGPAVAGVFLATGPAWRGLAVVPGLIALGAVGLACSPAARPAAAAAVPHERRHRAGPLRHAGFLRLLAGMALAGVAMSATVTGVAAAAGAAGRPAITGAVEVGVGVAAVLGGLAWGRSSVRASWSVVLCALFVTRGLLALPGALFPGLWVIGTLTAIAGIVVSQMYVVAFTAADQLVMPRERTEASTWTTSLTNLGMSSGTALAGWIGARNGEGTVFLVSALLLAAAAGVVLRPAWRAG